MQIRCNNCHIPFNFNRDETLAALDEVQWEGLKYHSVNCPRCRRVNKLSKKQLRMWAPGWKPSPKPKTAAVKDKIKAAPKTKSATAKTKVAPITKASKAKTSKSKKKSAVRSAKAKTKTKSKSKS